MDDIKTMSTYALKKEQEDLILYLDRAGMDTKGIKKIEDAFYPDLSWRRTRLRQIDDELSRRSNHG